MSNRKIKVSGDLTSDEKFKKKMEEIKGLGYVPSHRHGDTGVGNTLEDLLGIEENSIQASDINDVELKANRKDSSSNITLMTKSPDKRGVNKNILREEYGYQTPESKDINPKAKILHTTVDGKDFNTLNGKPFMKLTFEGDKMYLEHFEDGRLDDIYWSKEQLEKAFEKKYPAQKIYHVQAEVKVDEGEEKFYYDEADSLEGFSFNKMMNGLESGDLKIDIRLGLYESGKKAGKEHDNGTAIRIPANKLEKFFNKKKKLL